MMQETNHSQENRLNIEYKKKKTCPLCQGHKLSELNGTDIKFLLKRKKADILLKLLDPSVFNFFKKKNFSLQNS